MGEVCKACDIAGFSHLLVLVRGVEPPFTSSKSQWSVVNILRCNSALVRAHGAFGFWTIVTVFVTKKSKIATIRKRGKLWQAQICIADYLSMSKSFGTKRAVES